MSQMWQAPKYHLEKLSQKSTKIVPQKIDGSFCSAASPTDDSDGHTTGSWVPACMPLASTSVLVPTVWAVGAFWG